MSPGNMPPLKDWFSLVRSHPPITPTRPVYQHPGGQSYESSLTRVVSIASNIRGWGICSAFNFQESRLNQEINLQVQLLPLAPLPSKPVQHDR